MRRMILVVTVLIAVFAASPAKAESIRLYLDTAPNASGSSDWAAFRDAAYSALYNNTFVNQAHSTNAANAGTLNYDVEDVTVYSFGDLGHRLHAFYYVPEATTASLLERGFQVSLDYLYDGISYNPYEEVGWGTWVTPGSWANYDGDGDGETEGVVGSIGNGLWGAYGLKADTPEARAALASDILETDNYLGNTRFLLKMDGEVTELTATHVPAVPEPTSMLLLGTGLFGLAGAARRRLRK